jgi:hypothetical protein
LMYQELSKRQADPWEYLFEQRAWHHVSVDLDLVSLTERIREEFVNGFEVIDYVYAVWKDLG